LHRTVMADSVVKKRTGAHEDMIREYRMGNESVTLGPSSKNFHSVLKGVPVFVVRENLIDGEDE
jgi:circadian clock protein KaiC